MFCLSVLSSFLWAKCRRPVSQSSSAAERQQPQIALVPPSEPSYIEPYQPPKRLFYDGQQQKKITPLSSSRTYHGYHFPSEDNPFHHQPHITHNTMYNNPCSHRTRETSRWSRLDKPLPELKPRPSEDSEILELPLPPHAYTSTSTPTHNRMPFDLVEEDGLSDGFDGWGKFFLTGSKWSLVLG